MIAIVPTPLPDECVRSVAQRLSLLTGDHRARYLSNREVLELLVERGGLPLAALVKDHSHAGYLRFVSREHASTPVHKHHDLLTNYSLLRWPTGRPRVCSTCVGQDLDRLGISYYRRSHQLPGVEACISHRTPLVEFRGETKLGPLVRLQKGGNVLGQDCVKHLSHPVISRFVELSMMALKAKVPIDPAGMSATLSRRAAVHDVRITANGKGRRLGDWARSVLPSKWIASHFPALHERPVGEHAPSVDDVFRTRHVAHKTASYLLVMALLWDSPEEAMYECTSELAPSNSGDIAATGLRVLEDVLQGKSIMSACRAQGTNINALEIAIRLAFDRSSLERYSDLGIASQQPVFLARDLAET